MGDRGGGIQAVHATWLLPSLVNYFGGVSRFIIGALGVVYYSWRWCFVSFLYVFFYMYI